MSVPNPVLYRRLLIAAAIFHLAVSIAVCGAGRLHLLPQVIDGNGIAVGFASDGIRLRSEADALADDLIHGHLREWLGAHTPFHLKLYSISFAILRPLFGPNILSGEPLNLICYLAILMLVFYLGRELFNDRAGFMAAALVAIWPTFLLHTTQLLKDPFFIAGTLAFVLINVRLLNRKFLWPRALLTATLGGMVALFVWLVRDSMGGLLLAITTMTGVLLLVRMGAGFLHHDSSGKKPSWKLHAPAIAGIALLIFLSAIVVSVVPEFQRPSGHDYALATSAGRSSPVASPGLAARINRVRQMFVAEYPGASSNIDGDVQLNSLSEVIVYLPRAAMIGFFAPFPRMWLATGNQVGRSGRLLAGFETVAFYTVEAFALLGLWNGRKRLSVWLLWLIAAFGLVTLGLVVVNAGALYRLRYVFVILLVVVACERLANTFARHSKSELFENAR